MQMADEAANLLADTLYDLEEPFSPVLEKTAKSVTESFTNVLQSAADTDQESTGVEENLSSQVKLLRLQLTKLGFK